MSCPISWSIIIKRETTKAKTIVCSSPPLCRRQVREARSVVESGSAAYSNITAVPHEYFLHTGFRYLGAARGHNGSRSSEGRGTATLPAHAVERDSPKVLR